MTRVNYDKLYRVTNYETHGTGAIADFSNNTSDPVTGFNPASSYFESFAYDKAGNRTTSQRGQVTESYAKSGANAQRNRYDSISYSIGATSLGTATFNYDANGAALTYTGAREDTAGNWTSKNETRVFDHADRLVTWKDGNDAGAYVYGPLGRRLRKDVYDFGQSSPLQSEIEYAHAGASVVSEYSANASTRTLNKEFVYGGLDEPLRMSDASGTAVTAQFFTMNSNGSVLGTHSTTGARTEGYEYRCFGTTAIHDGSGVAVTAISGNVGNLYRFHGRRAEFEEQSPLYFHRTRHYEPDLGRFVGHDKPGDWYDGANLGNGVAYCHNDPVNFVDPFGHESLREEWGLLEEPPLTWLGSAAYYSKAVAYATWDTFSFFTLSKKDTLTEARDRGVISQGQFERANASVDAGAMLTAASLATGAAVARLSATALAGGSLTTAQQVVAVSCIEVSAEAALFGVGKCVERVVVGEVQATPGELLLRLSVAGGLSAGSTYLGARFHGPEPAGEAAATAGGNSAIAIADEGGELAGLLRSPGERRVRGPVAESPMVFNPDSKESGRVVLFDGGVNQEGVIKACFDLGIDNTNAKVFGSLHGASDGSLGEILPDNLARGDLKFFTDEKAFFANGPFKSYLKACEVLGPDSLPLPAGESVLRQFLLGRDDVVVFMCYGARNRYIRELLGPGAAIYPMAQ